MPDTNPITGGCLCGAVRYEITAEPMFGGKCYCDDCRRSGGTGHVSVMAIPDAGFKVTGATTGYTSPGGSGQPITRRFCTTCGTPIHATSALMPDVAMVRASTLDDPETFQSQMSIFAARAPSWDKPPAGTLAFDEAPPPQDG